MKNLIILFFAFILIIPSFSQNSPYSLSWGKDIGLMVGGAGSLALGTVLGSDIERLTANEISALDAGEINGFDRSATENYSEAAALRSDILLFACLGSGLATPFLEPTFAPKDYGSYGKQAGTLLVMWFETNWITLGGTEITKTLVRRTRPFVYNPNAPMDEKMTVDARKAFFSGHTSLSSGNAFFAARVFADYFPDSKWKPYVWALAAIIPAWTGLERYNAGKHYPTDVITGYAWGALCGYLIPVLHKNKSDQDGMTWNVYPISSAQQTGMGLNIRF